MTQPNQYIADLQEMRATLVSKRRDSAARKEPATLTSIQDQIDRVDRAISDERKLVGPSPAAFGTQMMDNI